MPSAPALPWLGTDPSPPRTGRPSVRRRRPSIRRLRRVGAAMLLGLAVWLAIGALRPAPPPHSVVTPVRDLPAGHALAAGDLVSTHVPVDLLPPGAVGLTAEAVGRRLARAVGAHEIITDRSLVVARDVGARQRAVHVPVADPGVLVFVHAGDRLDLIEAGAGRAVARDVRVLAVDDPGGDESGHGLLLAVEETHLAALVPAMTNTGGVTPVLRTS